MKEPFEIGAFLHTANRLAKIHREVKEKFSRSDTDLVLLITGRTYSRDKYTYQVHVFFYSPYSLCYRLVEANSVYSCFPDSISSPVLEKEGWQLVDVAKSEMAKIPSRDGA